MNRFLLVAIFILFNSTIKGQDFSLEILDAKGDFGTEERQGFVTKFDLPYQTVKKEWWRYVRRFAMISNKKTHYENRILAKRSGAASDIFFLSFLDRDGDDSYIYAALRKDSEDGDNAKVFKKYLRDLILDFKVAFYSEYMQEQIENKEKERLEILEGIRDDPQNDLYSDTSSITGQSAVSSTSSRSSKGTRTSGYVEVHL